MERLEIHLITYNVAELSPAPRTNLSSLVPESRPDVVLVGFQEVNSQPLNVLVDTLIAEDDPWTSNFRENLSPLGYVKVRSIKMLGVVLSLFCLDKHLPYIRGMETQYTRLGLGGYWGNKGAVSIRFQVYGVSVCVVNTHLHAHDHQKEERISAYNNLIANHAYSDPQQSLILYHDYVFWLGDLNFRLEVDTFDFPQIEQMVFKGQLDQLLEVDQLTNVRKAGLAFSEFSETLPTFPPSFKYKVGSDTFDAKRRPAWTDRILYKVNKGNYDTHELELSQHSYESHSQYLLSDHKPVTATFSLSVFSTNLAKSLLLDTYFPVVRFHTSAVYYTDEDIQISYRVDSADRKQLKAWDWIGLYRMPLNLENHHTFSWAPTQPVQDGSRFEAYLDDSVFLRTGDYRFVYFSAGSKHILGVSSVFQVRFRDNQPEVATEAREDL